MAQPTDLSPPHAGGLVTYTVTWLSLLALTGLTFAMSRLSLGPWNLPVAMAIATIKGSLVVLLFMHLKDHAPSNRAFFVLALAFIALLMGLVLTDVATRLPTAKPADVTFDELPRARSAAPRTSVRRHARHLHTAPE